MSGQKPIDQFYTIIHAGTHSVKIPFRAEADQFSMIIHVGTHVDAPCHFCRTCWRLHEVPFDRFIGPAAVIDIKEQCDKNSNYELTVQDIKNWEEANGPIPEGAIVMVRI